MPGLLESAGSFASGWPVFAFGPAFFALLCVASGLKGWVLTEVRVAHSRASSTAQPGRRRACFVETRGKGVRVCVVARAGVDCDTRTLARIAQKGCEADESGADAATGEIHFVAPAVPPSTLVHQYTSMPRANTVHW